MFGIIGSIIVFAIGFVAGLLVGRKNKAVADQAASSARFAAASAEAELSKLKTQISNAKK